MKCSVLVLVLLCLIDTCLCGRLKPGSRIGKRLTTPRFQGLKSLFHAIRRTKFFQPPELPANKQALRKFAQGASSQQHAKKVQDETVRWTPSLVQGLAGVAAAATAGTAGAAIGAGVGLDWDLERLRVGMQNVRGSEGVPSLWEFALSGKSDHQGISSAPPAPPPGPQEEERDSPSQSHHDDALPPPGNWAFPDGTFSIATKHAQGVFKYTGDFVEGWAFDKSYVEGQDGKGLIMKRPRYTETDWEDNLQKECFMAKYLNLVGVSNGVANCIGERTFEPNEVAALKASHENMQNKKEYDNKGKWHAILLEGAEGKSFRNTELSLSKAGRKDSDTRAAETTAVETIIRITGQMLKSGVVNVDQRHNILVNDEGEAKFIDMEGANFLTDAPLQRFLADVGKTFKHEMREMKISEASGLGAKWQVTQNPPPEVLNEDEAERQVKLMVTNIFGLVPPHAIIAAEKTLASRERLRNPLDDIVDEAWAVHKSKLAAVQSKWLGDEANTKAELPSKVQKDFSRPPGYESLSRSLTRYSSEFNDSPNDSPKDSHKDDGVQQKQFRRAPAGDEEPDRRTHLSRYWANPLDHSRPAGSEETHRSGYQP